MSKPYAKYVNWFLVNFIFCLVPVVVSWCVVATLDTNVYLGFLSYSFTLLLSSLYIFEKVGFKPESPLRILSWIFVVLCMILYCYYPYLAPEMSNPIGDTIASNKGELLATLLLITLVFSFLLNKKSIEDEGKEEDSKAPFENAKDTKKEFDQMQKKLKEGD